MKYYILIIDRLLFSMEGYIYLNKIISNIDKETIKKRIVYDYD
jgi:hypothetical protein